MPLLPSGAARSLRAHPLLPSGPAPSLRSLPIPQGLLAFMSSGFRTRGRRRRKRAARPSPASSATSEGEEPLSPSGCSPLSSSSPSGQEEKEEEEEERAAASRSDRKAEDSEITGSKNESLLKDNLSPWEEWFIEKEKKLRAHLEDRAKQKRWKREQKLSKEMAEKATRELEKMQLKEKAEVKYQEWLKKKRAEEAEKKKKEQEKEKEKKSELQEKKEKSEKIFKEWLHNARNKPRPILDGYGFPPGKSAGYSDGNSYPVPAYCNPIPWKPIHVPPPKEENLLTMKKSRRAASCQSRVSSHMELVWKNATDCGHQEKRCPEDMSSDFSRTASSKHRDGPSQ
ncbi:coiled-coil domain-containing protein 34 isoform X5 [Heliangelus exortis]|uniref:coiled-coil domain-containing protein 34 isoform X5 n=1 Tax=Heliangelus exortis TaxID=472823 RepID=UPI003A9522AC